MKPGIYEMVNAKQKPCFVAALEGRRIQLCRMPELGGWGLVIKRTRKPIAGVYTAGAMAEENIAHSFHTKRTVGVAISLSDESLAALANIFLLAAESLLPLKELSEHDEAELDDPKRPLPLLPGKRTDPAIIEDEEDLE